MDNFAVMRKNVKVDVTKMFVSILQVEKDDRSESDCSDTEETDTDINLNGKDLLNHVALGTKSHATCN